MNKRGVVTFFLKLMVAVALLILALALAGPIKQSIDITRNATAPDLNQTGLDCVLVNGSTNTTINDFTAATCVATDLINPLFLFFAIGLAGAIIVARLILR